MSLRTLKISGYLPQFRVKIGVQFAVTRLTNGVGSVEQFNIKTSISNALVSLTGSQIPEKKNTLMRIMTIKEQNTRGRQEEQL